jgi:solute carrier family 35 protein C2
MVKSGAPVFVLLFAFAFGLEKPNVKLIAIISVIVFGVYLMVSDETKFHLLGYILVQVATVSAGLRWAMTQVF